MNCFQTRKQYRCSNCTNFFFGHREGDCEVRWRNWSILQAIPGVPFTRCAKIIFLQSSSLSWSFVKLNIYRRMPYRIVWKLKFRVFTIVSANIRDMVIVIVATCELLGCITCAEVFTEGKLKLSVWKRKRGKNYSNMCSVF